MRWIWIDKFIEFDSGRRAVAVKNVTLAEDHLHDHFPGFPVMPASLMIEGMAQTAGVLVGEARNFEENLKKLWWKLDAALNAEDVYYSALLAVMDAAVLHVLQEARLQSRSNQRHGQQDI